MSRKKLISTATLSVLALLILSAWSPWWSPWNLFRYHGDGKFSDGGFFRRPRYVVKFTDIPLYETSEHRFHFRGLPNEEMTLILFVKGRSADTDADRRPLEQLKTTIEATLTDDQGKEACHGLGQPSSGNRDGMWVLMSDGESGYWHWGCNHVPVHSKATYTLVILVTGADPKDERVVVTPTLQGGGLELP
jgi:hypothetical protein